MTILVGLVAACATPRLEPPALSVSAVRVDRLSGAGGEFTVIVAIANPNERGLAVAKLETSMSVEGVPVGTARLAAPVHLPPRGEVAAALSVQTTWSAALRALAEVARRFESDPADRSGVRYAVSGVATLEGGRTIPFSRNGQMSWPSTTARR